VAFSAPVATKYKAVLAGIDYSAASQKWHQDAVDLRDTMLTWDNWKAGEISLLGGQPSAADILTSVGSRILKKDEFFMFYYSGHGDKSTVSANESVPPAMDAEDDVFDTITDSATRGRDYPNAVPDDYLANYLKLLTAEAPKLAVLDSCYAGGFWNGRDIGDLERVQNTSLLASVPENTKSPGSSDFTKALIEGATKSSETGIAPADADKNHQITVDEWFSYADSKVPRGLKFGEVKEKVSGGDWSENYPKSYYYDAESRSRVVFYDRTTVPADTYYWLVVLVVTGSMVLFLRMKRFGKGDPSARSGSVA
jgi:hypothetical protein